MTDRDSSSRASHAREASTKPKGPASGKAKKKLERRRGQPQDSPKTKIGALEARIEQLAFIASESRMFLRILPAEIRRWDSARQTRRQTEESQARYRSTPDDPSAAGGVEICDQLNLYSKREIEACIEEFKPLRARWVGLESAVSEALLDVAPELARSDHGQWSDAPDGSVIGWIELVHDRAVQEMARLRRCGLRIKEPVSIAYFAAQTNIRVDLISKRLHGSGRAVGGTKRKPAAEFEDLLELYPEHAATLRRIARP